MWACPLTGRRHLLPLLLVALVLLGAAGTALAADRCVLGELFSGAG
jgi:hypothetical protein